MISTKATQLNIIHPCTPEKKGDGGGGEGAGGGGAGGRGAGGGGAEGEGARLVIVHYRTCN